MQGQTTNLGAQPKEPLEWDYCSRLVPATLPHMYGVEWGFLSQLKKQEKQLGADKDPGKSLTWGWRYYLKLSEADFEVFTASALRYVAKRDALEKEFAAFRAADEAQHPELHHRLSESAQKADRALIRGMDKAMAEELDNLHAHLAPNVAKALDERIVVGYTEGLRVPSTAPRASSACVMPNP
jgi:hypothetical protein